MNIVLCKNYGGILSSLIKAKREPLWERAAPWKIVVMSKSKELILKGMLIVPLSTITSFSFSVISPILSPS